MEHEVITVIGIDVSKGKSMVSVRRPGGQIILPPIQVSHTTKELAELAEVFERVWRRYPNHYGAYRYVLAAHYARAQNRQQ